MAIEENLLDFLFRIDYCVSMKKVLIICYYWPPSGGPGAQRNVKFVKYLEEFGWQANILTVKQGEYPYIDDTLAAEISPEVKIHRTNAIEPFTLYRRLTHKRENESLPTALLTMKNKSFADKFAACVRANLFVPDARIGWIPFAVKRAKEIIATEKIDLIYTSSPPHSLQLSGLILKSSTHLPWVADLRDPWTQIRYYEFVKRFKSTVALDCFFERKILTNADRIVTVSDTLAREFMHLGKISDASKMSVLPNGYDESDYSQEFFDHSNRKFSIIYAGNMLSHQNPDVLWKALDALISDKILDRQKIKMDLYGKIHPEIEHSLRGYGLNDIVCIHDFIPHQQIVNKIRNSDLLLMVVPQIKHNEGIVTGKLFEYIGSGKPILIIGPPEGDAGQIVQEFENCLVVNYTDLTRCQKFIAMTYKQWQLNEPTLSSGQQRAKYSRRALTQKLTTLFNEVTDYR